MILSGILLNLTTIIVTLRSTYICHCSTARLFLSSYVGNIFGLVSLALNGIYTVKEGVPCINCQHQIDLHFLLYLGFTVNMIMLINSTYNRYRGVSNVKNKVSRVESNRKLFIWYGLPSWVTSSGIATLLILFMRQSKTHPYIVCGVISIIPMLICIVLNILLKLFLNRMKRNAEKTHKTESVKNISLAISMLGLTTVGHCIYLITGILVFFFIKKYQNNTTVYLVLDWISRMLFDLMFTVEAKAFLIKHTSARKDICHFFKYFFIRKHKFNSSVISTRTEVSYN